MFLNLQFIIASCSADPTSFCHEALSDWPAGVYFHASLAVSHEVRAVFCAGGCRRPGGDSGPEGPLLSFILQFLHLLLRALFCNPETYQGVLHLS